MLRKKIGDYFLAKRIGSGGMSDVFLGINPRSREKRAFKILRQRPAVGSFAYGHLICEMDAIRDMSHPGIIKIIDSGILEDFHYFSMEYMPGGNLSQRLERGKMPVDAAIKMFAPICDAMAYAHEQGIAHRDLKPSNILLNENGKPVISDFGIARTPDLERTVITRPGEILGRIAYLSPEQRFSSKSANRRADVFALGAILYQMLMGFPPLGSFPRPMDVQPDFPEWLQAILEKCLALDPDQRFEHAGSLLVQLERWPEYPAPRTLGLAGSSPQRQLAPREDQAAPMAKIDRIEGWLRILRSGTARERLAIVREMVDTMTSAEAKTIVKLYAEEEDRVRWGLIRVLGELKIEAATTLILTDMNSSFCMGYAIEALGKIGSYEAYNPILDFISNHPDSALIALHPLARTGKKRAIKTLEKYLSHETAALRQAAVCALASIECAESLVLLREHLCVEADEKVRAALVQSVHTLQRVLHPAMKAVMNDIAVPA
jgi:HEAT repeat protein